MVQSIETRPSYTANMITTTATLPPTKPRTTNGNVDVDDDINNAKFLNGGDYSIGMATATATAA